MKNLISCFAFLLIFNTLQSQEITMFSNFFGPRFYQDEEKLKFSEVNELMLSQTEASIHWKKSKNLSLISGLSALGNLSFLIIELTDNRPVENTDNTAVNLTGYITTFVGTLVFDLLSRSQAKKAVLSYNSALEKKTTFKLEPSKQGLGIAITF